MAMQVRDGGVWKDCRPQARDAGVWKDVKEGWARDAGVWKRFFISFEASVSPPNWDSLYTNAESPVDQGFSSTVTGGTPGFTYAWSLIAATGFSFVGGTTSGACTVRATGTNVTRTGTLRLTVTDSASEVLTVDVGLNVSFEP